MSDFTRADLNLAIPEPAPAEAHAARVTLAEQAIRDGQSDGLVDLMEVRMGEVA